MLTSIGNDLLQIGALADDRRGPLVVRTPVALHVGFADRPAGGDAYPNSLMGNIAFNRQAFLDAQWYQQAKSRPHSAALEAMQPALAWVLESLRIGSDTQLPGGVAPADLERFRAELIRRLRELALPPEP